MTTPASRSDETTRLIHELDYFDLKPGEKIQSYDSMTMMGKLMTTGPARFVKSLGNSDSYLTWLAQKVARLFAGADTPEAIESFKKTTSTMIEELNNAIDKEFEKGDKKTLSSLRIAIEKAERGLGILKDTHLRTGQQDDPWSAAALEAQQQFADSVELIDKKIGRALYEKAKSPDPEANIAELDLKQSTDPHSMLEQLVGQKQSKRSEQRIARETESQTVRGDQDESSVTEESAAAASDKTSKGTIEQEKIDQVFAKLDFSKFDKLIRGKLHNILEEGEILELFDERILKFMVENTVEDLIVLIQDVEISDQHALKEELFKQLNDQQKVLYEQLQAQEQATQIEPSGIELSESELSDDELSESNRSVNELAKQQDEQNIDYNLQAYLTVVEVLFGDLEFQDFLKDFKAESRETLMREAAEAKKEMENL